LLSDNKPEGENEVYVAAGYWRKINTTEQSVVTNVKCDNNGQVTEIETSTISHFLDDEELPIQIKIPKGISTIYCKIDGYGGLKSDYTIDDNKTDQENIIVLKKDDTDAEYTFPANKPIDIKLTYVSADECGFPIGLSFTLKNIKLAEYKIDNEGVAVAIIPGVFFDFSEGIATTKNTFSPWEKNKHYYTSTKAQSLP
jgi:hypothetical protein